MYSHTQHGHDPSDVLALRQKAGKWIRTLREHANLSQRDLAKAVGIEYYTFISQIEAGRGRVPPSQYHAFAKALGIPVREFVHGLMRYYDPVTFDILFITDEVAEKAKDAPVVSVDEGDVTELAARIARLELLLDTNELQATTQTK